MLEVSGTHEDVHFSITYNRKKRGKNKFLIVNMVDITQIKYHKAITLIINNITGMRLMI